MVITLCFLLINKKITTLSFEDLDTSSVLNPVGTKTNKKDEEKEENLKGDRFDLKKKVVTYITFLKKMVVVQLQTQKIIRDFKRELTGKD